MLFNTVQPQTLPKYTVGYPAQNFARAAFGGAKSSGNKLLETDRMDLICGDDMFRQCSASDVEPFSGQREGFPAKKGIWGVPEAKKRIWGVPEAFRRLTVQENP